MQPHDPYLSIGPREGGISTTFGYASGKKEMNEGVTFLEKVRSLAGKLMEEAIGWRATQKIRKALNLTESIGNYRLESIAKKHGKIRLKRAYQNNLKKVLVEVQTLVDRLPDKVVITSDHGELLGEEEIYGHPKRANHFALREVPWLEVEK